VRVRPEGAEVGADHGARIVADPADEKVSPTGRTSLWRRRSLRLDVKRSWVDSLTGSQAVGLLPAFPPQSLRPGLKHLCDVSSTGSAGAAGYPLPSLEMRRTWDALAAGDPAVYVGAPARGAQELADLFGRLGGDPRGGTCIEVGCGPGRMTSALAQRFDVVIAVDVSQAMLEQAHANVTVANVRFQLVSGERLDGVADRIADTLVCYLVLQHLPDARVVSSHLREFARVLATDGEAFVQIPVLEGWVGRTRRLLRKPIVRLARRPQHGAAFRGYRLTGAELERALDDAGLRVSAEDEGPSSYRSCRDRFLRLTRR
jgi:ubiquinone/menaquinone biosynthesis C-methylase UbiE